MMSPLPLVVAAIAFALASGQPASAAAQATKFEFSLSLSAAATKSVPPGRSRASGQIACTISGCHRIPRGCHPEMGYTWDGIPTGLTSSSAAPGASVTAKISMKLANSGVKWGIQ